MTFKQAIELGGVVCKGETSTMVVFASGFSKAEADAMVARSDPFPKAYTAFNVAQIDGLPDRLRARTAN